MMANPSIKPSSIWMKHAYGMMKINCDAALSAESPSAGLGVIM